MIETIVDTQPMMEEVNKKKNNNYWYKGEINQINNVILIHILKIIL